jgi:hypothetical protein
MTWFSAKARVYKALLALEFFDGRRDVFCRMDEVAFQGLEMRGQGGLEFLV